MHQQPLRFQQEPLLHHQAGRSPEALLDQFVQVVRCQAQLPGVVGHLPFAQKVVFQQLQEASHGIVVLQQGRSAGMLLPGPLSAFQQQDA